MTGPRFPVGPELFGLTEPAEPRRRCPEVHRQGGQCWLRRSQHTDRPHLTYGPGHVLITWWVSETAS